MGEKTLKYKDGVKGNDRSKEKINHFFYNDYEEILRLTSRILLNVQVEC